MESIHIGNTACPLEFLAVKVNTTLKCSSNVYIPPFDSQNLTHFPVSPIINITLYCQ